MPEQPVKYDDYNKNSAVKNLDKNVSQMIGNEVSIVDSSQITYLNLRTPKGVDSVRFKGGRMDGKYIR